MRALSEYLSAGDADTFFLLVVAALVFFMQSGFGMLEAGSVRAKNTRNILLKNLLDACIGALIWWAWGYGVAYGGSNQFIGTINYSPASSLNVGGGNFMAIGLQGRGPSTGAAPGAYFPGEHPTGFGFALWFFQYVFAAAAATIVSGAVAERAQLGAYLFYTVIITGFVYPVVVHWGWDSAGWLSSFNEKGEFDDGGPYKGGVIDFAGSGIVHMVGGIAAIWGAFIIGPRKGRFDGGKPVDMPGHSSVLSVLGTLILWLGWYGFNPGSTLGIAGYGQTSARVAVCTTLSAATGGLVVVLMEKLVGSKQWDVAMVCNGILAGLVSITAGCSVVYTWHAALIGFLGGFVYFGTSKCVLKCCKIDDPLDAFAVHGACGCWGVIAAGLFAVPANGYQCGKGAFYGGSDCISANLTLICTEFAWVSVLSMMMFGGLKVSGCLRISIDVEEAGMDISKHGGSAYNGIAVGGATAAPTSSTA